VGGAITTVGRVAFDDLRVAHVLSPVSGRVTSIAAQPGQRLKRGAPLCTILSPDLGQAFSDLAKAEAVLGQATSEWRRQKELFAAHATPQRDYEAAESAYLAARAEEERARRKALLLKRNGGDAVTQEFTLTAPIDGEVIARNVSPGLEVQGIYGGGTSVELFTVGELDRVWVIGDVAERDIAQVKVGAPTIVTALAYPAHPFEGAVEWLSSALDPDSHTSKLRVSLDNRDRLLKPGMSTTVSVSVEREQALAVPRGALIRFGDQLMVFVQRRSQPDGRLVFARRPVAVDEEEGGEYLPVTHGLLEGEPVVTSGALTLLGMM
jgi:cobalt-zinc-cadmium efflux system membrane fusion protein